MRKETVKKNMSQPLISVKWNAKLSAATKLMQEADIRHLPVVDSVGTIVGILSDRNIQRAMNPRSGNFTPDATADKYMSWPVLTVNEKLSVRDAAQAMIEEKISALLVTNDLQAVIGIITTEDMLQVLCALLDKPGTAEKLAYSPVIGEFLREAQTVGM